MNELTLWIGQAYLRAVGLPCPWPPPAVAVLLAPGRDWEGRSGFAAGRGSWVLAAVAAPAVLPGLARPACDMRARLGSQIMPDGFFLVHLANLIMSVSPKLSILMQMLLGLAKSM
eukprot:1139927-Pelagomonas_calceolata.AAC.4